MATPTPPKGNVLDKFITIGAQAQQLIGIWMPQVNLGIELVKTLIGIYNKNRADGEPAIPVPPDDVLIAELKAVSTRIVERGQTWLDAGGGDVVPAQPVPGTGTPSSSGPPEKDPPKKAGAK